MSVEGVSESAGLQNFQQPSAGKQTGTYIQHEAFVLLTTSAQKARPTDRSSADERKFIIIFFLFEFLIRISRRCGLFH